MNKKLFLTLLITVSPVLAGNGLYIGAALGGSALSGRQSLNVNSTNTGTLSIDNCNLKDTNFTGEALAGYEAYINRFCFGIEGLYSHLNSSSEAKSLIAGSKHEHLNTSLKEAYGAAFKIGYQVVEKTNLYIRLGWEARRVTLNFYDEDNDLVGLKKSYRSQAFVPGIGVEFKYRQKIGFRLEARCALHPSKSYTAQSNKNNYSRIATRPRLYSLMLGVTYKF